MTEDRREFLKTSEPVNYPPADFTQQVYEEEIINTTDYGWFESDEFTLAAGINLEFHMIWHGNVDIFIDKIIIFEQNFADLYVHPTLTMPQIRAELDSAYNTSDFAKIQNFYFDEPFQLTAKARGDIQSQVRSLFGGQNSRVEINGATGGYPKYYHDFDSAIRVQPPMSSDNIYCTMNIQLIKILPNIRHRFKPVLICFVIINILKTMVMMSFMNIQD